MAPPAMMRSLRHHNYRMWATADLVSVTGTWMQVLALNWLILSITGSATSVGVGLLLQTVPTLLLAPWGGMVADRLPARMVVMTGQVMQALLSTTLAVIAAGDPDSTLSLYAISFVSGAVTAMSSPSLGRFGAEVVGREDLSNALALGSLLSSGGRILGMSLAGVVIPLIGTSGAFAANAASFGVVIVALALMRRRELHHLPRAAADERGVVAGLRYVLRTPWMLVTLGLAFVLGSLGRNYQVTMAAMSHGPLDGGASGYGALSVTFAVGTILGGAYAAARARLSLALLLTMAGLCSAGQLLSGGAPGLLLFGAVLLPIAAGAVVIDTTVSTRVQLDSPERLRGRVIAAQGMVGAASGAVGGPLLGVMCDALGPRTALSLAGAVSLAAALAAAVALLRMGKIGRRGRVRTGAAIPVAAPATVPAPAAPEPEDAMAARS